jgi:16S rRNA (uracil1498-N3)-methyltransferase
MARRRFFVDAIHGTSAVLAGDEARHLGQVLRAEAGQLYEISDNHAVYLAEIESVRKDGVRFRIIKELAPAPATVNITLMLALIKFDRYEWALEKTTELGVAAIVPVEAERSEKGLRLAAAKRMERWRKIVRESSQQARRARIPEIMPPVRFPEAVKGPGAFRCFLDEQPGAPPLLGALPPIRQATGSVRILIGPEGGWTDSERSRAGAEGWTAVSLGSNILRAETAAIAAVAVIASGWPAPASVDSFLSPPLS